MSLCSKGFTLTQNVGWGFICSTPPTLPRPRKRSQDMYVSVQQRLHTHSECGMRFHLFHTSYMTDYRVTPIKWRCLLRVLSLVRRAITTLNCVQFMDKNLVFVVGLGPETRFRACVQLLLRPRHITKCWLSTQHFIFLFKFCLETSKALSYQWRHFGRLKGLQSRLTIRANTNVFLWPSISLIFINTGQDGIYLSLKDCTMLS